MSRQINHKTMRVIVGLIAFLLSPVVYLLSGCELTSISISYWTDSRDVFVGSLIAVGFFLSAYNGTGNGRDGEYYLSRAACIFAVCVAIFPTAGFDDKDIPATWVLSLTSIMGVSSENVHYGAAILLFLCLIIMIWFFSVRALSKGKAKRAYFYRGISLLIVTGMVGWFMVGERTELENTKLLVEAWCLMLFSFGWLAAGVYKTEPSLGNSVT